jgi:hypothetical protein
MLTRSRCSQVPGNWRRLDCLHYMPARYRPEPHRKSGQVASFVAE